MAKKRKKKQKKQKKRDHSFPKRIRYVHGIVTRTPTISGVSLKHIPPRFRRILVKNKPAKWYADREDFTLAMFRMEDDFTTARKKYCVWIDPKRNEIVDDRFDFQKRLKTEIWWCAICGDTIDSSVEDFSYKNFLCRNCWTNREHFDKNRNIKKEVFDNMKEFTEHCTEKILNDRERLYHKVLGGSKRILNKFNI